MSNSLDKLKALTSRLEEKLEAKKMHSDETQEGLSSIEEEPRESAAKRSEEAEIPTPYSGSDATRRENIVRVKTLFEKLNIYKKAPDFDNIFKYKAMNLSGIGLKEEDFGEVREGKYIQIIAITYEPDKNGKKKAKNISLGYFGKAETLELALKNEIIEFVLRWRYEKAFQNVEHYKDLIARVEMPKETLF